MPKPLPTGAFAALVLSAGLAARAGAAEPPADEEPKACDACATWNVDHPPFRLYGRSWYVGPAGLAVVVVDTGAGLVLLDGALPQSVPGVVDRLVSLGLSVEDVRWILLSHPHFDHAGGIAALQRRSGATVVTTEAGAAAIRAGGNDPADPQAGWGADAMGFPPVTGPVRVVTDGEVVALGETTFVAHATPGHTAGGLTWTWSSCEPSVDGAAPPRCTPMVYADSLNPVAGPGFRFGDDPARVASFEASIDAVGALPCGVLVPVHPGAGALFERAARAAAGEGPDALVDPRACRSYADDARRRLRARLAEERRASRKDTTTH